MKRSQFGLFAGLVAVVVGYAFYDYRSEQGEAEKKSEEAKLFSVPKEGILGITIRGKHDTVELTQINGKWQVDSPVQDAADEVAVDDFLNEAMDASYKDVVSEKPSDLAVFGLDKPAGEIRLSLSGVEKVLEVSSKKNFEGDVYVKYQDQPQVMIASPILAARLDKKAFDYRDRRLFRGIASEIEELHFQGPKGRFVVISRDAVWQAKDQPKLKLDQGKVRSLLEKLGDLRASDYLQPGVLDRNVKASIKLIRNDHSLWTADFFISPEKIYSAKSSDPKQFIKLNPYEAEKVVDVTLDDLRDRAEAFRFDRNDVKSVHIQNGREQTFSIDQDHAKNIVGLLRNAEIDRFFPENSARISLKKEFLTIVLLNSEGKAIYSFKVAQEIDGRYVARSSSYSEAFMVSKQLVDQLTKDGNDKD